MFPYIAEANFEAGTAGEWSSETDTESKLTIRHYSVLAQHGARLEVPYQGAYCMHIDLSGGTADAYVQEDTLYDLAADATLFIGFAFYAKGLVMAASDRFTIYTLQSGAGTDEVTISVVNNAGRLQFAVGETGATALASCRLADLLQDRWHWLELAVNIDAGGGNDGTILFYLDGYQIGAQITGLDQGVITQLRTGAIGIDAGTTAGHLLFDSYMADDTRIFPLRSRRVALRRLTKTGHAFVGPGALDSITLIAGSDVNSVLTCYDTDEANTNDAANLIIPPLHAAQAAGDVVTYVVPPGHGQFARGCYAVLAGLNPQGEILAKRATDGSLGALKAYAAQREPHGVI